MKHPSLLQFLLTEAMYNKLGDKLLETRLCQMAIDRSKYKEKVDAEIDQIVINMILVRISSHNSKYSQLLNHWKTKLRSHIDNIRKLSIKNDSADKRKKIINILFDEYDLNWREFAVIIRVQYKLEEEGIDPDSKEVKDAITWLISEIKTEKLQNVLVSSNNMESQNYIDKI